MKPPFAATVWREGKWCVSQCLEVDVASQGEMERETRPNLKEALELDGRNSVCWLQAHARDAEAERA